MNKNWIIIIAVIALIGISIYSRLNSDVENDFSYFTDSISKSPSIECSCVLNDVALSFKEFYSQRDISSPFTMIEQCNPNLCGSDTCKGSLVVATPFGPIQGHQYISFLLQQNPSVIYRGFDPATNSDIFEAACESSLEKASA